MKWIAGGESTLNIICALALPHRWWAEEVGSDIFRVGERMESILLVVYG